MTYISLEIDRSEISVFNKDEFDKHSSGLFASEQSVRTYSMIERSWAEQRGYLDQAVACLDKDKQAEAKEAFGSLEPMRKDLSANAEHVSVQRCTRLKVINWPLV
ncbi:DUF5054 domain-containing protein [Paenibacillus etheri]|uniref:DUF5054 domain-containing protein n=1 Tax=Paenibacillus etheri TaxID=1306852 RepID=UPI001ADFEA6C|nr:DUF5054 domain-containing protein [Paenibacillus etheri]